MTEAIRKLFSMLDGDFDSASCALQPEAYAAAYANENASVPEKVAGGFAEFLRTKPIRLRPEDILAGQIQFCNAPLSTPYYFTEDTSVRPLSSPYAMTEALQRRLNDTARHARQPISDTDEELLETVLQGFLHGLYNRGPIGHVIPGFENVVKKGYRALAEEIVASMSEPHTDEERAYLRAMGTCVRAAGAYCLRYAETAEQLAAGSDGDVRLRMDRIAASCRRIACGPAENFFDAVQAVTLMQELIAIETPSGSLSLGRMDQLFFPYYARDLEAGAIDAAAAREIIDAFRIKLGAMTAGYQNLCIGGCDENGKWAGNAVTEMILDSTLELRMDQPLLSLRCTEDMPAGIWEKALQVMELGDGFPAMFNDRIIRASLEKLGCPAEDSWNYGLVGCVEPVIGGREFSNTEEMRVSWAKAMELALNGGRCRLTGREILGGVPAVENCASFEEFYAHFKAVLRRCLENAVQGCELVDRGYCRVYPVPYLSLTMDGCIPHGQDAADENGTIYRRSSINSTGMANAIDSLLAVKELVFERGLCTLSELNAVLDNDFAGADHLRALAHNLPCKLGNDCEEAEEIFRELSNLAADVIVNRPNCRNDRFRMGMYSVSHHAAMGELTGALPDGRRAKTSLANGMSPVQGADRSGPTAVLNAITTTDHRDYANGMVLDLKFNPDFFRVPAHRASIRTLIETYFAQGGMEVQLNVVNRDTLLAAQADPDQYRNLIVRVSGFSAYFVTLDKTLQDEIIARTEHTHA